MIATHNSSIFYLDTHKKHSGVLQEDLQGPELERKIRKLLRLATKDDPVANKTYALRDSFSPTGLGKPPIFLELASFSLENSLVELAQECVSEVPQEAVRDDPLLLLQWEILRTQLLVACSSRSNGGMYSLEAVEARVQGVRRLEEVLTSALKRDNSDLVEVRRCVPVLFVNFTFCMLTSILTPTSHAWL